MPQLMQFEDGLNSCHLLSSARMSPKVWQPIFSQTGCKNQFTSDEFLDEVVAEFSETQAKKRKEVDVYKLFCDFIMTLDDMNGMHTLLL